MATITYCIHAAVIHGIEALPVSVEVSVGGGLPGITIVGMPDAAVLEARHRVNNAIKGLSFEAPRAHVTVNLAPSELRKTGTGLDLAIATGILACTGQIPTRGLDGCLFVGELSLSGEVSSVRGIVAYQRLAEEQGLLFVGPPGTASVNGSEVRVIQSLAELKAGVASLAEGPYQASSHVKSEAMAYASADFSEVIDQEMAKRAFVIAAAGSHGMLMVGPPGAGKSMMAKRMPSILPELTEREIAESLLIHSVAGQPLTAIRNGERPFRAPHHSISVGGLLGGGRPVRPGEVSLAHNGVLFLDELPEFGPSTLQSLRQPLEDHEVRLVRVEGTYVFPCDFLLVAAANPCPCGYLGDPDHTCTCPPGRIQTYQSRIGGPLMDRIDVLVDVARPSSKRIIAGEKGTTSQQMAEQVACAQAFASWRRARFYDDKPDRAKSVPELALDGPARAVLESTASRLGLGGRNIVRIARVARTIADIAEHELVGKEHVMEACLYRTRASL